MNIIGGKIHPEELQAKEKFINPLSSDEAIAVTVEEKLMGTLLINSENDKKYGDLKRLIINIITQGHNNYPNIKDATYTILWKYVPERTENKNE